MNKIFIPLVFVLFSCSEKKKTACLITYDELNKNNKVFLSDSTDYTFTDKAMDSIKGGAYFFNKEKIFESYKFFATEDRYTYSEEYNSKGQLIHTDGFPMVYKNIKEVNKDSTYVTYYFYCYNKEYNNPTLLINEMEKVNLILKPDTLYSNMLKSSFGFNSIGRKFIRLNLEVTYYDHCLKKSQVIVDTVMLTKEPRLEIYK